MIFLMLLPAAFICGFSIGKKRRIRGSGSDKRRRSADYKTAELASFLNYDGSQGE